MLCKAVSHFVYYIKGGGEGLKLAQNVVAIVWGGKILPDVKRDLNSIYIIDLTKSF